MMAPRNFGPQKKRLMRGKARPPLSKEDPQYWERLLSRNQLSMERGQSKYLSYGHRLSALDFDGVRTYATAETLELD